MVKPSTNKTKLAAELGISRSSLYYHPKQPGKDNQLKDQILDVLAANPAYGYRRVSIALGVNKKRVQRVMQLHQIKPYKRKARWRKRQDERVAATRYKNLIKGKNTPSPGQVYVGDFTYIKHFSKYIYLATYMDIATREIVGWDVSNKHTNDLIINALTESIVVKGKPEVVHTDQGSEYRSQEYISLVEGLGIQLSMSKKGSPWENGYQESFYNNFKTELGLEFERFSTTGELIEGIHQTIHYYNNYRIHSRLKMPPAKYRILLQTSESLSNKLGS